MSLQQLTLRYISTKFSDEDVARLLRDLPEDVALLLWNDLTWYRIKRFYRLKLLDGQKKQKKFMAALIIQNSYLDWIKRKYPHPCEVCQRHTKLVLNPACSSPDCCFIRSCSGGCVCMLCSREINNENGVVISLQDDDDVKVATCVDCRRFYDADAETEPLGHAWW